MADRSRRQSEPPQLRPATSASTVGRPGSPMSASSEQLQYRSLVAQNESLLLSYNSIRQQMAAHNDRLQQDLNALRQEYRQSNRELQWTIRKLTQENAALQAQAESAQEKAVVILSLEKELESVRNKWREAAGGAAASHAPVDLAAGDRPVSPVPAHLSPVYSAREQVDELQERLRYLDEAHLALNQSFSLLRTQYDQQSEQLATERQQHAQTLEKQTEFTAYLESQLAASHQQSTVLKEQIQSLEQQHAERLRHVEGELQKWAEAVKEQAFAANALKRENFALQQDLELTQQRLLERQELGEAGDAIPPVGFSDHEWESFRIWVQEQCGVTIQSVSVLEREVKTLVERQAGEIHLLNAENTRLANLLQESHPVVSNDSPSIVVEEPSVPGSPIAFSRRPSISRDRQQQLQQLQAQLEHLQSKYDTQVKINAKIKKLISQATSVGIPSSDIQIDVPEGVRSVLREHAVQEGNTAASFAYSNSPAAIKNHIQLIDLYNHSLQTIAKLVAEQQHSQPQQRRFIAAEKPVDNVGMTRGRRGTVASPSSSPQRLDVSPTRRNRAHSSPLQKPSLVTETTDTVSPPSATSTTTNTNFLVSESQSRLEEERDAWKNNTRRLESDIWKLQRVLEDVQKEKEMVEGELVKARSRTSLVDVSTEKNDAVEEVTVVKPLPMPPKSAPLSPVKENFPANVEVSASPLFAIETNATPTSDIVVEPQPAPPVVAEQEQEKSTLAPELVAEQSPSPARSSPTRVPSKSLSAPQPLTISHTQQKHRSQMYLLPESKYFEFGFCKECRDNMMINI